MGTYNLFDFNKNYPPILKEKLFPSLNGLRGISIIVVVIFHLTGYLNGGLGVTIFFIISGFLISILFLREKADNGKFSLKYFYQRRMLLIFPVLYLYLAVLVIINIIFHLEISKYNLLATAFYVLDFSYFRIHYFTGFTAPLWSLSVEEQFYLIIPFLFKRSYALYVGAVLFLVFILPLLCLLQEYCPPLNTGVFYGFTHFLIKFQAIAVGCLVAILVFHGHLIYKMNAWVKVSTNLLTIFIIIWLNYETFYSIKSVFSNLFICFLIAFVLCTNLVKSNDVMFRFLNLKPLIFIGVISYSLYVWHALFMSGDKRLPYIMIAEPYNVILIVLVSCLSYYGFERIFLRLKNKLPR